MNQEDDQSADEREAGPRSPVRTVQVLHELATSATGVALAQLAERLKYPKTSLFRLLRSLEAGGYVISDNGVHQVGPEAIKLGMAIVQNRGLPKLARPAMEWLSGKTRETIILGFLDETEMQVIYSDVIEATNVLRFIVKMGTAKPLYTSASGLTILAHMAPEKLAKYVERVKFVRHAARTISTVTELKRKLKEVRERGVAVSVDGMFDDVFSIAAPIIDSAGAVRAAISVSAPTSRGAPEEDNFSALVKQAGGEISRLQGYTGAYPPPAA